MDSQTSCGTRERPALCFITNAKARAENLKGMKTQRSIIKVGGESETVDTFK